MRVFAYCVESAERPVGAALGVTPLTSPPVTSQTFDPKWLEGYDLIYFRLHRRPKFLTWFNDAGQPALDIMTIHQAKLGGAVVIVANCFGASDSIVSALYMAGAAAVIAGEGPNYAASNIVIGTDLLAQWVRRGLAVGLPVRLALAVAKARLALTAWRHTDRDAVAFRIIGGTT